MPGEIHAVLGENGAGKSTLMKIIYGAVRPDAGALAWNGAPVAIHNPRQARALGIAMVFQHFALFETLTVAENVWLGLDKKMTRAEVAREVERVSGLYGLELEAGRLVSSLSVGERQRVEILRALLTNPQLLILDEPTAVLTPQMAERLFVTLRQLAAEGCSIVYISHKLDEVRALCTRCTVLRGGRAVGSVDPRLETNRSLSELMLGAAPPAPPVRAARLGETALEVRGLSLPSIDELGVALANIDLGLRSGEILGVAGVSGNGQARAAGRAVGRGPARARRQHPPVRPRRRVRGAAGAPRAGPPLHPRGAHRPRLGPRCWRWPPTRCSPGASRWGRADGCTAAARGGWPPASSRASASARAGPTRWRGACRAETCRSSSSGARSAPRPRCWWWGSRPGASTSAPPR